MMSAKLTFWPPETGSEIEIVNEVTTKLREIRYHKVLALAAMRDQRNRILTEILEDVSGPFQEKNGIYDLIVIPDDPMQLRKNYNPQDATDVSMGRFHEYYLELFLVTQGFMHGENMKGITLGYVLENIKEKLTLGKFLALRNCPLIKEIMVSADYFAQRDTTAREVL